MARVKPLILVLSVLVAVLALSACGGRMELPSNDALEASFAQGRTGVWLSGHGTIVRELSADPSSQRFQVRINDELALVVHHRVGAAGRVPVERGDIIAFHGRYDFHGGGGELVFTYADPGQPGGGGWLQHGRVRYD